MDERRQEAVAGAGQPGAGRAGAAVPRKYPKPPALWMRLVSLCLRPESWAEAARYPFWVTLISLVVALFVGATGAGIGVARDQVVSLSRFASNYDAQYSPMQINSEGVLSTQGAWKGAVRWKDIVVDPTDKTEITTLPPVFGIVIGSKTFTMQFLGVATVTPLKAMLADMLPPAGTSKVVDGATVGRLVSEARVPMFIIVAGAVFAFKLVAETLWGALTIYLISPLVMIGAAFGGRGLIVPRRVAFRIAGAVVVPLLIFSGLLQAGGYSASSALGPEGALVLWCAAASAMAAWAGTLARRMYVPAKEKERRT